MIDYDEDPPLGCNDHAYFGAEIDWIEANSRQDQFSSNIHYDGYNNGAGCHKEAKVDIEAPGIHDGFHVFSGHWTPDKLEWWMDGKLLRTLDDPPSAISRGAVAVIMSGGIFNKWWTDGAISDAELPRYNYVDYIRVWQDAEYGTRMYTIHPIHCFINHRIID